MPPLDPEQTAAYLHQVTGWELVEVRGISRIRRRFAFPDFAAALEFTNAVGALAEEQQHHPRIVTQWGSVTVDIWTHVIKGLHENDFVLAAKIDQLPLMSRNM